MNAIWESDLTAFVALVGEATLLLFEVLIADARPLKILTALTVFAVVMTFALGRSTDLRRLVVLWMAASLSVLLWTELVIRLHRAGLN